MSSPESMNTGLLSSFIRKPYNTLVTSAIFKGVLHRSGAGKEFIAMCRIYLAVCVCVHREEVPAKRRERPFYNICTLHRA